MQVDFARFEGSLPYASELYGVFQPLLGWKSRRIVRRFVGVRADVYDSVVGRIAKTLRPAVDLRLYDHPLEYQLERLAIADRRGHPGTAPASALGSHIAAVIATRLDGVDPADEGSLQSAIEPGALEEALREAGDLVLTEHRTHVVEFLDTHPNVAPSTLAVSGGRMLADSLRHESLVAGALAELRDAGQLRLLAELLFAPRADGPEGALALARELDPLETLDPTKDLASVILSPIGVVHVFRQYFFEFASFLGPPVQHLWLSPGGSVELVEVSTRRTLVERSVEQSTEAVQRYERSSTLDDELADAVKTENQADTKTGVSIDTTSTFGMAMFTSQIGTSTSFDASRSAKEAKEKTHKQRRQQTEKIATELKQSFKSTFRTVTETTDTTSKRYLLANNTEKLVNYELRRKMRQVGVQLQDLGSHLCWQTYVDRPGDELGIGELVHIAEPPNTPVQHPTLTPQPKAEVSAQPITMDFEWFVEDRQYGFVPIVGELELVAPEHGFVFSRAEVVVTRGDHWRFEARPNDGRTIQIDTGRGDGTTEPSVQSLLVGVVTGPGGLETDEHPSFTLAVTVTYKPSQALINGINADNTAKLKDADEEKKRLAEEAFHKAARERVEQASAIVARPFSELREEERIVVYRGLVRQLFRDVGIQTKDPATRHVLAELIGAMFDMDRMLYFVAPEWWVPKPLPRDRPGAASPQDVGLTDRNAFADRHSVSWGGVDGIRPDNYFITDKSAPARLGSSLGWVLQLDGDNLRNAFLNAPWVKAVIPIRAGRELAALNWLTRNHVEGGDGLDALYQAADAEERQRMHATLLGHPWAADDPLAARYAALDPAALTIGDAVRYLAIVVAQRHAAANDKVVDADDPSLSYLPTDKVYEKGFTPLVGGFVAATETPFEVFDQWVEVVPTDAIVPVEVAYDPKTGHQV